MQTIGRGVCVKCKNYLPLYQVGKEQLCGDCGPELSAESGIKAIFDLFGSTPDIPKEGSGLLKLEQSEGTKEDES